MEAKFIDERCPCTGCLVQNNCTDYCNTFHFYRRLILAEVDFFFAECIYEYKPDLNQSRFMSDLERQLGIAYNICPSDDLHKAYIEVQNKFRYLNNRFDKIISNSRKAMRGVSNETESKDHSDTSYSNFMKQVEKQRTIERRREECQSSI